MPSITFYLIREEGLEPMDWARYRDKPTLLKFLLNFGTAGMTVEANGEDVSVKIAIELARLIGAGLTPEDRTPANAFNKFLWRHAGTVIEGILADLERQRALR